MRRGALVVLLGLATACQSPDEHQAHSDEVDVIDQVWAEVFGQNGPAPFIDWVVGDRLDCEDGSPRWKTLSTSYCGVENCREGPKMVCVAGTAPSDAYVRVARGHGQALGDTALAHELTHAALMLAGVEDGDQFHRGPDWQVGGRAVMAGAWLRDHHSMKTRP
jgi:hypothetical protein